MKYYLKTAGLILLAACGWWLWYEIDKDSARIAGLVGGALWFGYRVIQDLIVGPIMYELTELNRRLDLLEGRTPRPSRFPH